MTSQNGENQVVYEFDGYRLDVAKRLVFGIDGRPLPLKTKAFDTLLFLVENPGRVVGRDEIMAAVWPETIVEENNLTQHISSLRRLFNEKPDDHRFIATVAGHGYRFVAEVQIVNGSLETAADLERNEARPRKWLIFLAAGVAAALLVFGFVYRNQLILAARTFVNGSSDAARRVNRDISITPLTSGANVQGVTISRDEKTFAYLTFDDGYWRVLLQQVGQPNAVEIFSVSKKNIDFGQLTFSPDGGYLYYRARNDGEKEGSLYRVSSFGGTPKKILTGISRFSAISFSPDGSEFAFSCFDEETKVSTIVIARPDGTREREVLSSGTEELQFPAWSPDGKTIAFARARPREKNKDQYVSIEALSVEGGPTRDLLAEKLANCFRIEWTSGGDGIVFGGTKLGEHMSGRRDQVWFAYVPTGPIRRISPEGSRYSFGGLSSNNAAIIFPQNRNSQIWGMDSSGDTRTAERLTRGTTDGRTGIAPLPDGRIGYMLRNGDNWEIWTMSADGSGQKQVFGENPIIEELRATPDGKYFVFNGEVNGNYQVFRLNSDGSGLKQLTFGDEVFAGDASPSSDSRFVVYGTTTPNSDPATVPIYRVPIDGGEPMPVEGIAWGAFTPHCSPDGNYVSYVDTKTPMKIGVWRASDAAVKVFEVVDSAQLNIGAIWTPNGKSLAYIADDGKTSNVWIQPIDGGPPRQLTDFTSGWIYRIAYSTDGKRLYLARGFAVNDALLVKGFAPVL